MTEFEGILNNLQRRYKETSSEWMREELEAYMSEIPCPECHGNRLRPESLAVTVGGLNIADYSRKCRFRRAGLPGLDCADRTGALDSATEFSRKSGNGSAFFKVSDWNI